MTGVGGVMIKAFGRYTKGELGDELRNLEWANDYRHFLALRADLGERLHEAA